MRSVSHFNAMKTQLTSGEFLSILTSYFSLLRRPLLQEGNCSLWMEFTLSSHSLSLLAKAQATTASLNMLHKYEAQVWINKLAFQVVRLTRSNADNIHKSPHITNNTKLLYIPSLSFFLSSPLFLTLSLSLSTHTTNECKRYASIDYPKIVDIPNHQPDCVI